VEGALTLGDLPPELVLDTGARFGQSISPAIVVDVLTSEQRKFSELLTRGRSLLRRLYPTGVLTEDDYAFLHDTHGLPRELVTSLVGELG
jgi:alanyl-tRNA synthetase